MECNWGLLFIECLLPFAGANLLLETKETYADNGSIKRSFENIVFHNVLGGINRCWKARIDWRNHINGFD
jgi:hypothetical protein